MNAGDTQAQDATNIRNTDGRKMHRPETKTNWCNKKETLSVTG